MTRTVRINRDRLRASLMELKEIGAYVDELAAHHGAEVAWEPDACGSGTDVLANAVLRLADQT